MRIGVIGLGAIGIEVARAVAARSGLTLAAAADASPSLAGGPLAGLVPSAGVEQVVDPSVEAVLARGVDALALCTGSRIAQVAPDLTRAVAARVHVVSTCEELAWPWELPEAADLDEAARAAGVTLLGTGVNPGFVMDRLPIQLAGMCVRVSGVRVSRVVDAGKRRAALQKKVGYGLTTAEFLAAGPATGGIGHVGLAASARILARGLGTTIRTLDEWVEPVAHEGKVLGMRQHLEAMTADGRPIALQLQISVGAPEPHDRVVIAGDPPVDVMIQGGMQGDRATVAAVVDALTRLTRTPRGLITVAEAY